MQLVCIFFRDLSIECFIVQAEKKMLQERSSLMRSISEVEPGEELALDEDEEAILGPVQLVKRYSATEAMQIHAAAAAAEFLKVITPPIQPSVFRSIHKRMQ